MRRHLPNGLTIAQNTNEILDALDRHIWLLDWPKKPNQTHDKYYTYDFSCNEDFILHAKYHEWKKVFDYFKNNDKTFGTAATKYVNKNLLDYNANRKVRIRFSLMPQIIADKVEPGTSKIIKRIEAVNDFYEAGYDVHLNYSPIIVYENYLDDYKKLFKLVDTIIDDSIKDKVKAECIFLTHNKKMHIINNEEIERLLWKPSIQETKISQYGNENIRYKYELKRRFIDSFLNAHEKEIPWQKVRYIF